MPKKVAIIALLVIAIIAVAGAITFIAQQQRKEGAEKVRQEEQVATIPETPEQTPASQPEKPATTEPIDTSDWKVYRNEKYGFEVRYPGTWVALPEIRAGTRDDEVGAVFYDPQLPKLDSVVPTEDPAHRPAVMGIVHEGSFITPALAERMVIAGSANKGEEILVGAKYKGRIRKSPGAILVLFNVGRHVYSISMLNLHKLKSVEERERYEKILYGLIMSFRTNRE